MSNSVEKIKVKIKTPAGEEKTSVVQERRLIETNAPDASHYQHYTEQRKHIYEIPDTYIGNTSKDVREYYIFDLNIKKFVRQVIEFPQGAERLFLEILSNAGDNVERSRMCKFDPGKVTIKMDRKWVIIRNEGVPLAIERSTNNLWVPYMVFGVLLTSSNYDKKKVRVLGGRNGFGAKLTNIFSKYFKIDIGDNIRKLRYIQIWKNNMDPKDIEEPIIAPYEGPNYTEVTYMMDFERFGYDQYSDESVALFAGYAADLSWTCKVPVTFNDIDITAIKVSEYAKYYFNDDVNMITHYEWPEEHQVKNKAGQEVWVPVEFIEKKGYRVPKDPNVVPISEVCILDTPDYGNVISFANGIRTMDGGTHVVSAQKEFSKLILEKFNKNKEGENIKLTKKDVDLHISMLISCRVLDPQYKGQTKEQLKAPVPKFIFSEKELKPVENWKLIDRLYAQLEAKEFKTLTKTDGKKLRHVNVPKLEDANFAGTAKSSEAVLFLTEGDSALGLSNRLIGLLPGGRDKYGCFPLKGKGLNILRASLKEILENEEYLHIKIILGARENVDYTIEANYMTLRYGALIILTDADKDGHHIRGLTTLLFHCRFPSLIKKGFIWSLRTRIATVKKGKTKIKFITDSSYQTWKLNTPNYESYKHEYFKGLATSEKSDIEEDSKDLKLVNLQYDDNSNASILLAFDKDSNPRKKWIAEFKQVEEVEHLKVQTITNFINNELILFEITNLLRSLPSIDGLKNGQRKILWYVYLHWKFNSNPDNILNVSALSGHVKAKTNYHYGDKALDDTIINLARQYLGTNNLSYLYPKGEFGSRYFLGEDKGASRYIKTYPMKWLHLIFKKEDIPLLTHVIDDGEEVEPYLFLPILPTVLFNGARGIGTGHSTFIPNFNPRDVAKWFKCRLENKELPELTPWYSKFRGTIKVVLNNDKIKNTNVSKIKIKIKTPTGIIDEKEISIASKTENEISQSEISTLKPNDDENPLEITAEAMMEIEDNEEKIAAKDRYKMVTYGKMKINDKGVVIIDELPIQKSVAGYKLFLAYLVKEGVIKDFKNLSNGFHDTVYFEVYGMEKPTYENLRLVKSFGLSNMVLLDHNMKPVKFDKVGDILEYFFQWRLPYIEKRRLNILKDLNEEKSKLDIKLRYLDAVVNGKLNIIKRPEAEIQAGLDAISVPYAIHDNTKNSELSQEKINKLMKEINDLITQIDWYTKIHAGQLWYNDILEFENKLSELIE
jgi:DNA topoisomerase II